MARDLWRWTDEKGVQRLVGTDELRAALANGVLTPSTLVWREGMKEWAPASTLPELASAAFAAGSKGAAAPPAQDPNAPDPSFNPRRTGTLQGLAPPVAPVIIEAKVPVDVPAAGERSGRPHQTQAPPFGAPVPEAMLAVPAAPRIPAAVPAPPPVAGKRPPPPKPRPKPERRNTANEVDAQWATITHSDDDETIPRRARPSELAAAAAAAAEATATLRDARMRARAEALAKKVAAVSAEAPSPGEASADKPPPKVGDGPSPPPVPRPGLQAPAPPAAGKSRPPPPPLPSARARLDAQLDVASKERPSTAPPPHPPPQPARPLPAAEPTKTQVLSPAQKAPHSHPITLSGVGMPGMVLPTKPVRIKPPKPVSASEAAEDAPAGAPTVPAPAGKPPVAPAEMPARALARSGAAAPSPRPPPVVRVAEQTETKQIVKTLVSGRDTIENIPGLAEAIAESDVEDLPTHPADFDADAVTTVGAHPASKAENGAAPNPTDAAPLHAANPPTAQQPAPTNGAGAARAPYQAHPPAGAFHLPAQAVPRAHVDPEPTAPLPTRASPSSYPHEAPVTPLPPFPEPIPAGVLEAAGQTMAPLPTPRPPPIAAGRGPLASDTGVKKLMEAASTGEHPAQRPPPPHELPREVVPPRALAENVSVPLGSLVGAGALLIGMVISAFFVGRASSKEPRLVVRPVFAEIPVKSRALLPAPPKPCWMAKQPAMWAPSASKVIPFEAVAGPGGALAMGYAQDDKEAVGIVVDLATGEVKTPFHDKGEDAIERVVPTSSAEFHVVRAGQGALGSRIEVPATPPFAVGTTGEGIAIASPPDATPALLWPLEGKDALSVASVRAAGDRGFLLVYRRSGAIWGGFIGEGRKPQGDLVKVAGSGGTVGRPAGAWNGREVAVVFADKPQGTDHYEIRIGHGEVSPSGAVPATTTVMPLPRGGPGGDAIAPEIAGLADGRWLVMWTEGGAGSRAVRAETLAPDFSPVGDPIALSPPAGNFGQGAIGVVGGHAAMVFLQKGSSSYELWGAVLQCAD